MIGFARIIDTTAEYGAVLGGYLLVIVAVGLDGGNIKLGLLCRVVHILEERWCVRGTEYFVCCCRHICLGDAHIYIGTK